MSLLHLFLLLAFAAAAEDRGIVAVEPPPTADAAATSARLLELSQRLSGAGAFGEEQRRDAGLALGYMRVLRRQLAGLTLDEDSAEARAQLAEMIAGAERSMNTYEDRDGRSLRPFLAQMAAAAGNQGRALAPPSREQPAPTPTAAAAAAPPAAGPARPDGRPPLPPLDQTPVGLLIAAHPQLAAPSPKRVRSLSEDHGAGAIAGARAGAEALNRDPGDAGPLGPGRQAERGGARAGAGPAASAADAALAARLRAERETPRMRLALRQAGLSGTADAALLASPERLRQLFEQVLPAIPENAADPDFDRLLTLEDYDELVSRFRAAPNGEAFRDVELRERDMKWARSCSAADSASCNTLAVARGTFYKAGKPVSAALLKDMLLALRGAAPGAPASARAAPAEPVPGPLDHAAAATKGALGLPLSPAENAALAAQAERERRERKAAWLGETAPALLEELAREGADVAELRGELARLSGERLDAVAGRLRALAGEEDRSGVEAAAEALQRELAVPGREGALAALAADARERERLEAEAAKAFAALRAETERAAGDGSDAARARLAAASRRAQAAQQAADSPPRTAPPAVARAAERLTMEKLALERRREARPGRAAFHDAAGEHAAWVTSPERPDGWWVPVEDAGLGALAASFGFGPGTRARRTTSDPRGVELSAPGGADGAFVSDDGLLTVLRAGRKETETRVREAGEKRFYALTRREGGAVQEVEEGELRNGRFVAERSRSPLADGGTLERRFHDGVWFAGAARGPGAGAAVREVQVLNPYFDFSRLPREGPSRVLIPGLEDPRVLAALQRLPPLASLAGARLPPGAKPSELVWDGSALVLITSTGDTLRISLPGRAGAFGVEHSDARGKVIFFRDYAAPSADGSVVENERELRPRGAGTFYKPFRRVWRPGPGGVMLAGPRDELPEPKDAPPEAGRAQGFADALQEDGLYQALNRCVGQPVGYLGRVVVRGTAGAVSMGMGAAGQLSGADAAAFISVRGRIEAELAVSYSSEPTDEQLTAIVDRALADVALDGQREIVRAALMDDALRALFASTPGDDWGRFHAAFKRQNPDARSAYRALAPLMAREGSVDGFLAQARKQGGWAKVGAMTISGADFMGQMAAGAVALKPLHMLGAWAGRASAGTRFSSALAGGQRFTSLHDKVAGGVARIAAKLPGAGAAPRAALSASDRSARAVSALVNMPVSVGMSVYDADTLGRVALLFAEPDPERSFDLATELAGEQLFRKAARVSQRKEAAAAKARAVMRAAEGPRSAGRDPSPDVALRPHAAESAPAAPAGPAEAIDTNIVAKAYAGNRVALEHLLALKRAGRRAVITPQSLIELLQHEETQGRKAFVEELARRGLIEVRRKDLTPEQQDVQERIRRILYNPRLKEGEKLQEGEAEHKAPFFDMGVEKEHKHQGGDAIVVARVMAEAGPGRRGVLHTGERRLTNIIEHMSRDPKLAAALRKAGLGDYQLPEVVRVVLDPPGGAPAAKNAGLPGREGRAAGWLLIDEMDDGRGPPPPPRPITGDAELDAKLDRVRLARGAQAGDRGVTEPVYQKQRFSMALGDKAMQLEEYVELVSGERFSSHDLDLMRASGVRPKVLEGMPRVKTVVQSEFDDDFVEVSFEDGRKALYQATGWSVKGTLSPWGGADGDLRPGTLDALWNKKQGPVRLSDGSLIEDAEVMLLFEDRRMADFLAEARIAAKGAAARGPLEAARQVAAHIERRMPYRGDGSVGQFSSGGGLIKPAHLLDSAGVCRHQNVLAALALEDLVRRGELKGRARYNTGPGHAWAEFWPSEDGTPIIIDIAQHYVGSAVESFSAPEPKGWLAYLLSAHEPPKRKLKTFYAGDKAGKPQYIPYLEPDSTPSTTK